MANININLGLTTLNAYNTRALDVGSASMAERVNLFFQTSYNFGTSHPYYSSSTLSGSTLRLNFSDGAYSLYSGIVLADPNAANGEATVTNLESTLPSYFRLTVGGKLNYHYDSTGSGGSLVPAGGTINDVAIQTLLPTYSSSYNSTFGNVVAGLHGALTLSQSGDIAGSVTSLTGRADKLLASTALSGNFSISGNLTDIGQNLTSTGVSGTADSYIEKYKDGSIVSLTNLALAVNGDTVFNEKMLMDGANLPGDDIVSIRLAGNLTSPWLMATGAGSDKVTVKGGGATLSVNAGSGNDSITLADDGHGVDGGAGTDTAIFSGARSAYTITKTGTGYSVHASGGTDTLAGIERLQFSDTTLALDINGNGGQVYRLYQAAFDRAPDNGGLGYWIGVSDAGMALVDMARNFTNSDEFKTMYGANPSNADFIDKLYHNVLHRAGDKAGVDYWLSTMNQGALGQAQVLAFFGESQENQAALIGTIGDGFTYTPYG